MNNHENALCSYALLYDYRFVYDWFVYISHCLFVIPFRDHLLVDTSTLAFMSNRRCNKASFIQ